MKADSAGGNRPRRPAQAIGQVRRKRRDRHLILHAGQVREAVAGGDAVIDHLQMRRQHRDADAQDRLRLDAFREDLLQRLRRRHGLARRAPGLERGLARARAPPAPPPSRAAFGVMPKMFFRKSPSAIFTSEVNPAPAASAACKPRPAAWPTASQRIVVGAAWWPVPGAAMISAADSAFAVCLPSSLQQPRGDRGGAERRREIARPDAAIEHARPVDRGAEPDHGLVAHDDGGGEIVGRHVRQRGGDGQRRRHHDRARRDHRAEVDVVDLAQSRQRHIDRQAVGQRIGVLAEGHERPAFRRAAGGDPGADQVGGVQPHVGAGALVGLIGGDEGAKLFEGRHRLQRFIVSIARALRRWSWWAICA